MISSDMHKLLSNIPKDNNGGIYAEIHKKTGLSESLFSHLVSEAKYDEYYYIEAPICCKPDSRILLTEKGKAELELYEQSKISQETASKALRVSRWAMWAAMASAAAALASLIKMFC